jgi:hypothetical protein
MPVSWVIVNSPTTHGAIGLPTALAPSLTLGCGSWGGNITSNNTSPLHLMDVELIAFETDERTVRLGDYLLEPGACLFEKSGRSGMRIPSIALACVAWCLPSPAGSRTRPP